MLAENMLYDIFLSILDEEGTMTNDQAAKERRSSYRNWRGITAASKVLEPVLIKRISRIKIEEIFFLRKIV